eukprot:15468705-Alexandrium_andersonii.AAC.1
MNGHCFHCSSDLGLLLEPAEDRLELIVEAAEGLEGLARLLEACADGLVRVRAAVQAGHVVQLNRSRGMTIHTGHQHPWPTIIRNCSKLLETARNCSKLFETARNCSKLFEIAGNSSKLLETDRDCPKLMETVRNCLQLLDT